MRQLTHATTGSSLRTSDTFYSLSLSHDKNFVPAKLEKASKPIKYGLSRCKRQNEIVLCVCFRWDMLISHMWDLILLSLSSNSRKWKCLSFHPSKTVNHYEVISQFVQMHSCFRENEVDYLLSVTAGVWIFSPLFIRKYHIFLFHSLFACAFKKLTLSW